jgi:hypothetical protein
MTGALLIAAEALLGAAAGYGAGLLHFRSLRRVADAIVAGRTRAVALQLARLAALGLFLGFCVWIGAPALLGATLGLTLARRTALREAR